MRILLSLVTLVCIRMCFGQIVDDSTKSIYGPKTTKFILEDQLLNHHGSYSTLDTSIYLLERQSEVDKSTRRYQDLGVLGSALFPIFYEPKQTFGRTSGFDAYVPYAFQPEEIKYYDSKSPFIKMFILLGGGNRNVVDIGFSRNVNDHWNIGFDYRRITVDKQMARRSKGDRQVEASNFVGYTHYRNGKLPYQVLIHYSQMNHNAIELGGIRYLTEDSLRTELFEFDYALLRLDEAQTNIRERRIHLYQDFRIAEQFQLYHVLDSRTEENTFKDFTDGSTSTGYDTFTDFYPNFFIDADSTYQRSNFSSFTNEAGFKGDLASVFYRIYLKYRQVDFDYNYLDPEFDASEYYVGGYTRFRWRDKLAVSGKGEYLISGEYNLQGEISSDLIDVSYRSTKYKVPFVYNRFFGNNHQWTNSFDPIFTNELKGSIKAKFNFIELRPKVEFTSYQNFVYFDQERQPRQNTSTLLLSSLGTDVNIRFLNRKGEGWHFENEFFFSSVAGVGASAMRVPKLYYNGRIYWSGNWFDDLVPFEVGFNTHARSSYFANTFAPEIQQFHLQDEIPIDAFFKADFFVNMRLDNFFLTFKWLYIDMPSDGGYFASPYYPGQPRVIDFSFKWMFFD